MNKEETAFNFEDLDEDSRIAFAICYEAHNNWIENTKPEEIQKTIKIVAYIYRVSEDSPAARLIALFFHGYIEGLYDGARKLGKENTHDQTNTYPNHR